MVSISGRVFLVVGTDFLYRQRAIENIKKKAFLHPSAFVTTTFYSRELDFDTLKEEAFTFSFQKEKLIIFKDALRLSRRQRLFLASHLTKIIATAILIFDIEKEYALLRKDTKISRDVLFGLLLRKATVFKVSSSPQQGVDEFRRRIRRGEYASSLSILEKLFQNETNEKSLSVFLLGILIQEFSYIKNPFQRQKYLSYLWQADRALKERGLSGRLALEMVLATVIASA